MHVNVFFNHSFKRDSMIWRRLWRKNHDIESHIYILENQYLKWKGLIKLRSQKLNWLRDICFVSLIIVVSREPNQVFVGYLAGHERKYEMAKKSMSIYFSSQAASRGYISVDTKRTNLGRFYNITERERKKNLAKEFYEKNGILNSKEKRKGMKNSKLRTTWNIPSRLVLSSSRSYVRRDRYRTLTVSISRTQWTLCSGHNRSEVILLHNPP